ncbi:MAG: tRNA (adenosine(37)-N6)-dimethylallyltransferase MiaA [Saprospiraceae bacterium]|nr:tRNA (adenosine(37)-N6)-dimethylallyltransferase MiaA [Saprospiraceae bacterium]
MKNESKYLIVIAGPTAAGKSDLAISLAGWLATEIISADSRQIYNELNIGTAKPSEKELDKVKHHFINELSVIQPFSAAQFETQGLSRLAKVFQYRNWAILCGGTGLYINALCSGLDQIPDVGPEVRQRFDLLFKSEGIEPLQQLLRQHDPEYADLVDIQNHRRLVRALAVMEVTGKPFSSFLQAKPQPRFFDTIRILLTEERTLLYQRIDDRVDQMISKGLEEEVRGLHHYSDLPALQTVGYQEWVPYFEGKIDKVEVIRLIKRNSRRYAKRQMTWFRKHGAWASFHHQDRDLIKAYIKSVISKDSSGP